MADHRGVGGRENLLAPANGKICWWTGNCRQLVLGLILGYDGCHLGPPLDEMREDATRGRVAAQRKFGTRVGGGAEGNRGMEWEEMRWPMRCELARSVYGEPGSYEEVSDRYIIDAINFGSEGHGCIIFPRLRRTTTIRGGAMCNTAAPWPEHHRKKLG
ncbi:hypothetical protein SEVIR_9G148725v4 [Setaria viridis]